MIEQATSFNPSANTPSTWTGEPPFDVIASLLSTIPLRRHTPALHPDDARVLRERAKLHMPPTSWFDEDFEGLQ